MKDKLNLITSISVIIGYVIFITSSYGIGKAETDKDKPLQDFAISGLIISIVGMLTSWIVQIVISENRIDIWQVLVYLMSVIISMGTLSASSYGLGKTEKDQGSIEYKASFVFFIVGLILSTATITTWVAANYTACKKEIIPILSEIGRASDVVNRGISLQKNKLL